jgi:hypothetical protein
MDRSRLGYARKDASRSMGGSASVAVERTRFLHDDVPRSAALRLRNVNVYSVMLKKEWFRSLAVGFNA